MYSERFDSLWQDYKKRRKADIEADQFASLLYTFPSVLVAYADGRIDRYEKKFIKMLPDVLAAAEDEETDIHLEAAMTEDYFKEVNYLLKHLDEWETPFLETLREQLHNSLHERNAIFQSMWRTADSSADISEAERNKIDQLSKVLGL